MNKHLFFQSLLAMMTIFTLCSCSEPVETVDDTYNSSFETEPVPAEEESEPVNTVDNSYDSSSNAEPINNTHETYNSDSEAERERMMNYVQSNSNLKSDEIDNILKQNGY